MQRTQRANDGNERYRETRQQEGLSSTKISDPQEMLDPKWWVRVQREFSLFRRGLLDNNTMEQSWRITATIEPNLEKCIKKEFGKASWYLCRVVDYGRELMCFLFIISSQPLGYGRELMCFVWGDGWMTRGSRVYSCQRDTLFPACHRCHVFY